MRPAPAPLLTTLLLAFTVLAIAACGPATRTESVSFIDPDYNGTKFTHVIIRATNAGLQETKALENGTAAALTEANVKADTVINMVPPTRTQDEGQLKQLYKSSGAQAVIVIHAQNKAVLNEIERDDGPGVYPYGGFGWGSSGRTNVGMGVGIGMPRYYIRQEPKATYNVAIYELPHMAKIYTSEFDIHGPSGFDYNDLAEHIGPAIVEKLQKDGLITRPEPAPDAPANTRTRDTD